MKVENMLKLKEEFDYKSLSRRLDIQLDKLIAEHERRQKAFEDEIERISIEAQTRISEVERNSEEALEVSAYIYIIYNFNLVCACICTCICVVVV
jgi:kinesin family protein 5